MELNPSFPNWVSHEAQHLYDNLNTQEKRIFNSIVNTTENKIKKHQGQILKHGLFDNPELLQKIITSAANQLNKGGGNFEVDGNNYKIRIAKKEEKIILIQLKRNLGVGAYGSVEEWEKIHSPKGSLAVKVGEVETDVKILSFIWSKSNVPDGIQKIIKTTTGEREELIGRKYKTDSSKFFYKKPLKNNDLEKQLIRMIEVLVFLQENKIVHNDIKPENLFFDKDDNLVLGDFGTAGDLSSQSMDQGTPAYRLLKDIEVIKNGRNYNLLVKRDMFSMGWSLLQLSTGLDVGDFISKFEPALKLTSTGLEIENQSRADNIKTRLIAQATKRCTNEHIYAVLEGMTKFNLNERMTPKQALQILKPPTEKFV